MSSRRPNNVANLTTAMHLATIDDDECPDYDDVMTRSNTSGSANSRWQSPFNDPPPPLNPRRQVRRERYVYTYNLVAGSTPIQFMISVGPENGKPEPGEYTFKLSMKVNHVESSLCDPEKLKLRVDPRQLDFVVFVFPGKASLPVGALWSLRVWLRTKNICHRVFGDDELLVGKDLDFNSIGDASFARLKTPNQNNQVYNAWVGSAPVTFIVSWKSVDDGWYEYSLEYESGGVGGILFDDVKLRLDGDPRSVSFTIYTVPLTSTPPGASHRIRVWMRSVAPFPTDSRANGSFQMPFSESFIYQRIWKSDAFKLGAHLDFGALGSKVVLGFSSGAPSTITTTRAEPLVAFGASPPRKQVERTAVNVVF
ncbi:hypothetical protein HGRIS_010088 [Hohenbuehelia grisea]|uniref:Uncharacterized protein n=1 Tax=Hohenbuehelia grisea TaxID=104357 RepID=A0ABR3J3L9_9AGAR